MTKNDEQVAEVRAASALEPTAVQAAREADADKNLPNANTDTERLEETTKGK
jgi:hypothetical protein